ncbi:MAG: hypothetical protein ACYDAR_08850 [Thermomicrobiales bacterium]
MDLLIAGLPASGIIVALVEGAKRAGLPTRWAPMLAVLLGLACGLLAHAAAVAPRVHLWYEAAGAGIALGLSAAGLYSGTKTIFRPAQGRGTDSA